MNRISVLEKKLGIRFKNKALLMQALTHRSYRNENRTWPHPHNERLEFLGDAVLEIIVTEYLFHTFPDNPEGDLTAMRSNFVSGEALSRVGNTLGIEAFLLMSKGEARDRGRARSYRIANAVEAIIGAIYLDKGQKKVRAFVERLILADMSALEKKDPKGLLQEKAQEVYKVTPTYQIMDQAGPDHNKCFSAGVYFGPKLIASGIGPSKQAAQAKAAENALKMEGWAE